MAKKGKRVDFDTCPFHPGGHSLKDDRDYYVLTVPEPRKGWLDAVRPKSHAV
jgi:hypothetical protein